MINVIIAPVISEKSMDSAAKGRYTFRVNARATKHEIKKAVEEKFKVNVLKISTITIKGRSVRAGVRRTEVLQSPFKKAVVTVKEGQKIAIFDSGAKE
jgi:large subunit ribosomal protein L23